MRVVAIWVREGGVQEQDRCTLDLFIEREVEGEAGGWGEADGSRLRNPSALRQPHPWSPPLKVLLDLPRLQKKSLFFLS